MCPAYFKLLKIELFTKRSVYNGSDILTTPLEVIIINTRL